MNRFADILQAITQSGALDYTQGREDAAARAEAAVSVLPESEYKEALIRLSRFAVSRNH
jgi:octaprenyl-diphosphate synthase